MIKITISVAALLLGFYAPSVNAEDGPAAIVADFNRAELVTLGSAAGIKTLQLGAGLAAGETVSVAKGGYLKLLVGKECIVVGKMTEPDPDCSEPHSGGNHYTVPEGGLLSGMAARYQRFQKVLSWWDPKTESRVMRSREGLEAQIPALAAANEAFLIAGPRSLQVQWVDGKGPFNISITDANGKTLSAQNTVEERSVLLPITIVEEASYRLKLESAGNVVATYALIGKPAVSFAIADTDLPLLRAMSIMEAVSKSDGAWALEAAQQFRTMKIDGRIRQATLDAVTFGDWP